PLLLIACASTPPQSTSPSVVEVGSATPRPLDVVDGSAEREDPFASQHRKAKESFRRGDYTTAIQELETAYRIEPRPELLYDMGECLEKLGRRAEAASMYERYVREDKSISLIDRMSVELRISQFRVAK